MKYRWIILLGMLVSAMTGGTVLGQHLGLAFSEKWTEQSSANISTQYQAMIEENLQRLEDSENLTIYASMEGFEGNGTIIEQAEEWNLILVNKWNELDAGYKPELTEIASGHKVDSRIVDSLREMIAGAKKAGYAIYILSSYRDINKQISLYDAEVSKWLYQGMDQESAEAKAGTIVAYPGTSEHHLGLAVDLVSSEHVRLDQDAEKTKGYQWLVAHCHEYGFILRYPNNTTDVTGIIYEPWHFRYVGEEAATEIMEAGITLEEYLSQRSIINE